MTARHEPSVVKEGAHMKKLLAAGTLILAMAIGTTALAQEVAVGTTPPDPIGTYKPFVVGGMISMGMAHYIGDNNDGKPRFAGGGSAYFDWYLMEILALEGGVGFVGKGSRFEANGVDTKIRAIYMDIALGAKLNIKNFRAGLFVVPTFGLGGKIKVDSHSSDINWSGTRRANLGLKVGLGYAIPVGPIAIVPGLDWSIHLINDYDGSGDGAFRAMNLMFNAAVEFGFGSK
jgi:hypothetical protein